MQKNSVFRKKKISDILNASKNGGSDGHESLGKHLRFKDLLAFGIAAIIGAGIFSTIGKASSDGGPAVIFLFIFTAVACGFAAFAYAEFASMVPVSGSAYTYSYVAFGEIIAWIIGWALIMEYAIGNITVAISWSDYFTGMLSDMNINLPQWIQTDIVTARNGFHEAQGLIQGGKAFEKLSEGIQHAYTAYATCPKFLGIHIVFDLPALMIITLITWLVYRGMKESRNASNAMVIIKLAIILLVIAVGVFYVDASNWSPFAPNGIGGVLKGVSAVFFAYIGFDAISTTAEECENPQRDLPRGMMWSIIICTILYVVISLILTGMVNYELLEVGDPLAFVFKQVNLKWMSAIIAVSAVVAMASVLLVFQMGQPRIWMAMSRDGLLPKRFSKIHPKYKTPSFATIVVGFVVAVPALFMNLTMVTDLCSIGTLFAFVLVCGGVLVLQNRPGVERGKFRTPYINSKFVFPAMLIFGIILCFTNFKQETQNFIFNAPTERKEQELITALSEGEVRRLVNKVTQIDSKGLKRVGSDLTAYFEMEPAIELKKALERSLGKRFINSKVSALNLKQKDKLKSFMNDFDGEGMRNFNQNLSDYFNQKPAQKLTKILETMNFDNSRLYNQGFTHFAQKIPLWIFLLFTLGMGIVAFRKNLSLIPLLGLTSCLYMMSQVELKNWIAFAIWLAVGLVIYFSYSKRNSKLNEVQLSS